MAQMPKPQAKTFDDTKLLAMVEPLTVRIEKLKGQARTPIPMPPGDDPEAPPGTGLTKDDIRELETWLVTQWTGGGLYEISVTDSSQPQPLKMTWQPYYPPDQYPERRAPIHDPNATPGVSAPIQPPQQPQQRGYMAFPNGFPFGQPIMPQAQFTPGAYTPYPPLPAPPPVGTSQWQSYTAEVDKRRAEDELRALREAKERSEREALAAKHAADLVAERQAGEARARAQEQQLAELRSAVASLTQMINNGSQKNPEIEALKLAAEQAKQAAAEAAARADRERAERESERRAAETRELIKTMNDNMQRQLDEARRSAETQIAALRELATRDRGPDPMLSLFTEMTRQNADALKEIARSNTTTIERIQAQQLRPADILDMATRATAGVEAATASVRNAYSGVFDLQTKAVEQLMQMQPQGSGVIDVVRDGVAGLKDFADRYVGAKVSEQRSMIEAQVQIAEAQVRAAAVANGQPMQPQSTVHIPPAPREQGQLAGPAVAAPLPSSNAKRLGRTDTQWFGMALTEVERMREEVATYINSMHKIHRGEAVPLDQWGLPPGMDAEQAGWSILIAAQQAGRAQLSIAAIIELLMQQRFAEFLDVLLPDAPQPYRDDVAQVLVSRFRLLNGGVDIEGEYRKMIEQRRSQPQPAPVEAKPVEPEDDDGDDDGDDDVDNDGEPVHEGKVVQKPVNGQAQGRVIHVVSDAKPKGDKPPARRA